jgi:hypothetical protein
MKSYKRVDRQEFIAFLQEGWPNGEGLYSEVFTIGEPPVRNYNCSKKGRVAYVLMAWAEPPNWDDQDNSSPGRFWRYHILDQETSPVLPSKFVGFSAVVETSSGAAKETARRNDLRLKVAGQFDDLLQARQSNRTPLLLTSQTLDFSRKEIKQVLEDSNGPI